MTKQLALIGTAVMTTLLALVALWQFRIVVVYVLISLVLAATFRPIARSESRHNLVTRLLLTLQYPVGLAVFFLLLFFVGRLLLGDFEELTQALAHQNAWTIPAWLEGGAFQQALINWIPTPDQLLNALASQRELVFSTLMGITQSIGGTISGMLIIIFLSIYWSINQNHFERLWLSLLPGEQRKHARYIWRTIEYDLGAYTRSEIIQSILAAILLGMGYWLLGSPFPTLLAVTGAIAWLIPVVGAVLAVILPFLLGLLTGTQLSLLSVVYTVVVLGALQIWIEPRLFKLSPDNPVLTFVILLAMADAFGLLGIIAAPPISVICQILWSMLVNENISPDRATQFTDLREQQERLQSSINAMEGEPPPIVASSMDRLTELIAKAEPILREALPVESPELRHPT